MSLTLTTLGYSVFEANMLAIPGYFLFFLNVRSFTLDEELGVDKLQILIVVWISERFRERLYFSAWSNIWTLPFLIGLICIPPSANPWIRYALLTGVNGMPYSK
jgi:hypothetical protein